MLLSRLILFTAAIYGRTPHKTMGHTCIITCFYCCLSKVIEFYTYNIPMSMRYVILIVLVEFYIPSHGIRT